MSNNTRSDDNDDKTVPLLSLTISGEQFDHENRDIYSDNNNIHTVSVQLNNNPDNPDCPDSPDSPNSKRGSGYVPPVLSNNNPNNPNKPNNNLSQEETPTPGKHVRGKEEGSDTKHRTEGKTEKEKEKEKERERERARGYHMRQQSEGSLDVFRGGVIDYSMLRFLNRVGSGGYIYIQITL